MIRLKNGKQASQNAVVVSIVLLLRLRLSCVLERSNRIGMYPPRTLGSRRSRLVEYWGVLIPSYIYIYNLYLYLYLYIIYIYHLSLSLGVAAHATHRGAL